MGLVVRPHLQSAETAKHIAELVTPPSRLEERPPDVPTLRHEWAVSRRLQRSPPPHRTSGGPAERLRGGRPGAGNGRRPPPHHDTADRRTQRGPSAQSGPSGGRARRLSGAAPTRRHHERSTPHARARVLRRRCRSKDTVQHGIRGPPRHGCRRRRRTRSFPQGRGTGLYQLSPRVTVDVQRAVALVRRGRRRRTTRPRPSPTSAPRSNWWRVSRWPMHCRATPGGRPRATAGASPPCSSTPPASWPRSPPRPGSSIWPDGGSSKRGSSSPTARRSPGPPCRWLQPKGTPTASDWSGATANAASTHLDPGGSPSARTEVALRRAVASGARRRRAADDGSTQARPGSGD